MPFPQSFSSNHFLIFFLKAFLQSFPQSWTQSLLFNWQTLPFPLIKHYPRWKTTSSIFCIWSFATTYLTLKPIFGSKQSFFLQFSLCKVFLVEMRNLYFDLIQYFCVHLPLPSWGLLFNFIFYSSALQYLLWRERKSSSPIQSSPCWDERSSTFGFLPLIPPFISRLTSIHFISLWRRPQMGKLSGGEFA